jgi:hypothetical protein
LPGFVPSRWNSLISPSIPRSRNIFQNSLLAVNLRRDRFDQHCIASQFLTNEIKQVWNVPDFHAER